MRDQNMTENIPKLWGCIIVSGCMHAMLPYVQLIGRIYTALVKRNHSVTMVLV